MAFYNGRDGVVKAGPSATAVGEVQSWSLDLSVALGEAWGMGDTDMRHHQNAPRKGSGSLETYLDPEDGGQALLTPGAKVDLELYPGGEASGSGYFSFSAVIESVNRSGSKDGIPSVSFAFKVDGAVTESAVA